MKKATIELDGWDHVLITIVRFRQTVVKDELGFNKQFHTVRAGLRGPTSSSFLFWHSLWAPEGPCRIRYWQSLVAPTYMIPRYNILVIRTRYKGLLIYGDAAESGISN